MIINKELLDILKTKSEKKYKSLNEVSKALKACEPNIIIYVIFFILSFISAKKYDEFNSIIILGFREAMNSILIDQIYESIFIYYKGGK